MPREIDFVVRRFPETQPLLLPSLIWGVIVISSWQVVLAVGLWAMFREHRGLVVLTRSLTAWVASPLLVVLALAVSAFVVLSLLGYMPPAVLFVLVAMGLISLATAASITVAYLAGPGDYAKPHKGPLKSSLGNRSSMRTRRTEALVAPASAVHAPLPRNGAGCSR
jgi:hypothetical protein